jgi:ubiquinone/menaquinone biosynthesis C-methylase UbiE
MMRFDELVTVLRCLGCAGPLRRGGPGLLCPACGRSYPVVDRIPVMIEEDAETEVWRGYFRDRAEALGDSEAANSYFSLRSFRIVRDNLLKLVGPARGLSILDVGCGTGHFSEPLAGANRLAGVDISLEMSAFAGKKGLAAVQASAARLPFAPGTFDLVIANNVIQSFKDGSPVVAEAARVLRPGGRLVLSATNGRNLAMAALRRIERRKYAHLGVYSAAGLKRLAGRAGLRAASVLFFFFPQGTVSRIPGDARIGFLRDRLASTVAVEAAKPALQ